MDEAIGLDAFMPERQLVLITREFLMRGRSLRGGWNKRQAEILGVRWPLRPGWMNRAIGKYLAADKADHFQRIGAARRESQKPRRFCNQCQLDRPHFLGKVCLECAGVEPCG